MVKEELIQFETKIGDSFNRGEIKAPIHLYHGNEDLMISLMLHTNNIFPQEIRQVITGDK